MFDLALEKTTWIAGHEEDGRIRSNFELRLELWFWLWLPLPASRSQDGR